MKQNDKWNTIFQSLNWQILKGFMPSSASQGYEEPNIIIAVGGLDCNK